MTNRNNRTWITCCQCGKSFSLMPSHYRKRIKKSRTGQLTCSLKCHEARRVARIVARITRTGEFISDQA